MKTLLTVSAVVELGAGLALVCCPSAAVAFLVGVPLEAPPATTVVRVGGAGLFALGVACWLASEDTQSRAAKGLAVAMLLYDIAAAVILAFAGIGGLHAVALWLGVALHSAMAGWCVACLSRRPNKATS